MMQNKKPAEAKALVDSNHCWTYLDVRSTDEFSSSHPVGAWNIPVMHRGPTGMTPNADFVAVVTKTFPKTAKLVVGCASGVRSVRACEMLEAAGYTELVNMEGGFMGSRDDFGRAIPGWASSGLPVESAGPADRTYAHLSRAKA